MNIKLIVYFIILLVVSGAYIAKWKLLAKGEKIIAVLMLATLISETAALAIGHFWRNNMIVYHSFNPTEFFLTSLYFNCSINYFRKRSLGLIIGLIGVGFAVVNTLFLQKITTINSNFLLFEGTAVIIYCLLSLHQLLLDENHLAYRQAHFWFTLCFLIYWSSTFTGWGLYAVFNAGEMSVIIFFDKILTVANYIFYVGIGITLAFYKRLIPTRCA